MLKGLLIGLVLWVGVVFGTCAVLDARPAECEGWVCFGVCGTASDCGHGCACVGASTGVGRCVSL